MWNTSSIKREMTWDYSSGGGDVLRVLKYFIYQDLPAREKKAGNWQMTTASSFQVLNGLTTLKKKR